MEKVYSLLSWNVEHFKKSSNDHVNQRVKRITQAIMKEDPDVFAIYEVEGKDIFEEMVKNFSAYSFHITEGPQTQEILVAVKGTITSFYTQKVSFKSGINILRPGALLTLHIDGENYPILFLHLKSKNDARSFGLRDDMLTKAIKFSKSLKTDKPANYLFIGDLNTMGLNYYFDRDIPAETELRKSDNYAQRYYKLQRLPKTFPNTYNNGSNSSYPQSNLDHCYAAQHLKFKLFNNKDDSSNLSPIDVRGWVDFQSSQEQDQWIEDYSDHAYLYLEVVK
ncbi:MAG: endonuclease/exonuclease/phosphatase family protein [Salinivirgaceae bacterium]|nr:endonuclease/exonuclease/phosphatase family protein [Salinivirgaceae bacterium]